MWWADSENIQIWCIGFQAFGVEYLRAPTDEDVKHHLESNAKRGFPGMFGSIDCMHWYWKVWIMWLKPLVISKFNANFIRNRIAQLGGREHTQEKPERLQLFLKLLPLGIPGFGMQTLASPEVIMILIFWIAPHWSPQSWREIFQISLTKWTKSLTIRYTFWPTGFIPTGQFSKYVYVVHTA